jgi:hypothetical protein
MARYPRGHRPGARFPMAGHPNIMAMAITPVAADPYMRRAWSHAHDFLLRRWRGFSNDYHFSRRRHCRALMHDASACERPRGYK